MIRHEEEMDLQVIEHMRDGKGIVSVLNILNRDVYPKCLMEPIIKLEETKK
jgi:hypothetical protein